MLPDLIRDARARANLTQLQAAVVCYVSLRTWIRWEQGDSRMPEAAWELFLIRTTSLHQIIGRLRQSCR